VNGLLGLIEGILDLYDPQQRVVCVNRLVTARVGDRRINGIGSSVSEAPAIAAAVGLGHHHFLQFQNKMKTPVDIQEIPLNIASVVPSL
jgi:hypothetical protein